MHVFTPTLAPTVQSAAVRACGPENQSRSHTAQVADIEKAERDKMRDKCGQIIDHGINCFVNRQLIYNFPEEIFADAGVMAIEHADFDGIERLARVTGVISATKHEP